MSSMETTSATTPEQLNDIGVGCFSGYLGIDITRAAHGVARAGARA